MIIVLVSSCILLSVGYLALAKNRSGSAGGNKNNGRQTASASGRNKAQQDSKPARQEQIESKSGRAIRSAVVNFAELARKESISPVKPKEIKDDDGPELDVEDWPLPDDAIVTGKNVGKKVEGSVDSRTSSGNSVEASGPSPAPSASFQALPDGLVSIPPDTHGAVGPNHLMVTLNTQVRIQNRSGNAIMTLSLDSFWSDVSAGDDFDPKVLYDPYAQRWMMTSVTDGELATSSVLIGVSQTSDPTGNWNLYRIDADSADILWADYPSIGFNKDWIVVSVNMFPIDTGSGRSQIYVFDKADLYAKGAGRYKRFTSSSIGSTQVPAITYDNTLSTMYLVNRWNSSQGALRLFTITGAVGSEVLTATNLFPSSPTAWSSSSGDFAPQLDSTRRINTGDARMENVVYRNGSLWCAHTIFLPGGGANRSAVQWWQIDPTTGAVQQRAAIDDQTGNTFYAYPSIAVNKDNDVLIGYTRFSSTQYASANYSFRVGTDPPNALRGDVVFKDGQGPYYKTFSGSRNRWGDYSSTVVDPINDTDMWTIQEYAARSSGTGADSGRWGTWWARVRADGSAPPPSPTPTPVPTPLPAPANDNFTSAQLITGCQGSVDGNNLAATKEAGEPDHAGNAGGKSVWYQWQAASNGTVTITTAGSSFDTTLAVYTGTSVNNLSGTLVAENDDVELGVVTTSAVTFNATAGTTYRIAVDGYDAEAEGEAGFLTLNWRLTGCVSPPPANNDFASAQTISGCTGSASGTNLEANREVGEPSHDPAGNAGGSSVWYQWQAPSSGSTTITTAGSSFDTLLGVYTGDSLGSLKVIAKNDDVNSQGGIQTSSVTFDATAGTVYKIAVDGWGGATGTIKLNWTESNCTPAATMQLGAASYTVGEASGHVDITVNRTNPQLAATIDYATSDTAGLNDCNLVSGIASSRCDYATSVGTLRFAIGESSKTISIPVVDDSYAEGAESFTITLSNPTGATLGSPASAVITITDNDALTGANPIDAVPFFVRQHYIDFLGREPDPAGYQGWQDTLNNCKTGETTCDRIEVSSDFFRSSEFQERGYFVYRFYSTLGRIPHYGEFMPDFAKVSGFLTAQQLEDNKAAFVQEFMTRTEFQSKYGSITDPTAYVDALLQTLGLANHPTRSGWINGLTNGTLTRAQVLRGMTESAEVYQKYYTEAFVVMQYFGYLRRDPDILYLEWIKIMNQNNGDYRTMINGFMNSLEYRKRFGS